MTTSAARLIHRGWQVSPYTAKTRAYLSYKRLPFTDVEPSLFSLYTTVRKNVGQVIMPTVELQSGKWLQDSSAIIDHFENEEHERPEKSSRRLLLPHCRPPSSSSSSSSSDAALPLVASSLLELFGDEFLIAAALHYRWGRGPVPYNFALGEFARCGLPFLPSFVATPLVGPVGAKMRDYFPVMGINKETGKGIEECVTILLAAMEKQLGTSPYVLGSRPCIGDFAIYGPLWAHLYRDGGAPEIWGPNVLRWMNKMTTGSHHDGVEVAKTTSREQTEEAIETLAPVFKMIVEDSLPFSRAVVGAIDKYCEANKSATKLPRSLGPTPIEWRGVKATRKMPPFHQWKVQRVCEAYEGGGEKGRVEVDKWLRMLSGSDATVIPRINNPIGRDDRFKEFLVGRTGAGAERQKKT